MTGGPHSSTLVDNDLRALVEKWSAGAVDELALDDRTAPATPVLDRTALLGLFFISFVLALLLAAP